MSFGIYNGLNSYQYPQNANFRGTSPAAPEIITKPIEKVETVINNTVDSFVKEPKDEEKKNHIKPLSLPEVQCLYYQHSLHFLTLNSPADLLTN